MQETKADTLTDGFYFLRDGEQLGPYQLPEAVGKFARDPACGYYVGTEPAPFQVISRILETHHYRLDDLESSSFSFLAIIGILFFGIGIGLVVANFIDFIESIK